MYSTTFVTTSNDYRLTVDASKGVTAAAWLTAHDCIFDRYCSLETTRFVITEIGILTLMALDKKFGTPVALSEDDLFQLEIEAQLGKDVELSPLEVELEISASMREDAIASLNDPQLDNLLERLGVDPRDFDVQPVESLSDSFMREYREFMSMCSDNELRTRISNEFFSAEDLAAMTHEQLVDVKCAIFAHFDED